MGRLESEEQDRFDSNESFPHVDSVMVTSEVGSGASVASEPTEGGDLVIGTHLISKRFGATQALRSISWSLNQGEIHALVGENGAGKSTLGKVISGVYSKDSGSLEVFGRPVGRWDTIRAQEQGIVLIAQELSLVPELTVAQNVFLGVESRKFGVLFGNVNNRYRELDEIAGFGLPGDVKVGELRIADQQKVEILRALARDARVLIMDEPTSSLTSDEAHKLHLVIADLKKQGRTVVYVTHFLDAVLAHTDRVTIMRDGRVVRTSPTANETRQSIVEGMLGRSLEVSFPPRPDQPRQDAEVVVELDHVTSDRGVQDVTCSIRAGEIVGLAGLVGSGRSEIGRAIYGVDPVVSGSLRYLGETVHRNDPKRAVRRGVAYVPEDRRGQGLALVRSVKENVSLPHLRSLSFARILQFGKEKSAVESAITSVGVSPPRMDLDVEGYSGGNQQKILFARWLVGEPRLVILDEPTRGVDVGAKYAIYETIVKLAEAGMAVLLISSEHEEVMNLSHRVLLVRGGTVIGEVDPNRCTVDDVLYRLFDVAAEE